MTIRQEPVIQHDVGSADQKNGTEIRLKWPDSACSILTRPDSGAGATTCRMTRQSRNHARLNRMIEKENIMPLNLHNDFTRHIRWMAQTETWRMSGTDGQEPVTWQHAIFDLANIQTGWGIFSEGMAPEWAMDPSLKMQAQKPQDGREWRRGFKVSVFSNSAFSGP